MASIVKDDDYAERIIDGNTDSFDAIEVQGVRSEDGVNFEVDNVTPTSFSTYVHLVAGGVDCTGDFTTRDAAQAAAAKTSAKYGWPVHDYTIDPK